MCIDAASCNAAFRRSSVRHTQVDRFAKPVIESLTAGGSAVCQVLSNAASTSDTLQLQVPQACDLPVVSTTAVLSHAWLAATNAGLLGPVGGHRGDIPGGETFGEPIGVSRGLTLEASEPWAVRDVGRWGTVRSWLDAVDGALCSPGRSSSAWPTAHP